MQFDLMHRRGADNTTITTWTHHFDPLATGFDAQKYELDMQGAKVDFAVGDKLVFRYSASNTIMAEAWIPNGDGKLSNGRVPNIKLPQ
ncbi:MAG TPA: hypothetical protein VFV99_13720 [Kofleriaceae bacterium]|nr:hypothetical protein [Kofleriaceae bacterium]